MTLEREGISSDRTFGIERSIALYCFFTGEGRSHFLTWKGRSPFTK
ncbi:hypothetical protein [Microcoleus sp. B4-D4]